MILEQLVSSVGVTFVFRLQPLIPSVQPLAPKQEHFVFKCGKEVKKKVRKGGEDGEMLQELFMIKGWQQNL